jgi:hypothetical protein
MFPGTHRWIPVSLVGTAAAATLFGLACAGGGRAAAAEPGPGPSSGERPPSANLVLAGSGGYTLYLEKERGVVSITVSRSAPAEPTIDASGGIGLPAGGYTSQSTYATSDPGGSLRQIHADLGPLGSVSLVFRPSGEKKVTRLGTRLQGLDCAAEKKVVRRLGTFEGLVVFHGEDGYTDAERSVIPGSIGTTVSGDCEPVAHTDPVREGSADTEAFLSVDRGALFVASRSPHGVYFAALGGEEIAPGVSVARTATVAAPKEAFRFAGDGTRATVSPPAPFGGTASFDDSSGSPSWTGDLSVEFPGMVLPLGGEGPSAPRLRVYAAGRG